MRNGNVGRQLALAIENARRDGVRISERTDVRRDPAAVALGHPESPVLAYLLAFQKRQTKFDSSFISLSQ